MPPRVLVWLLPATIVLYAVVAVVEHWWLSGLVAGVAALLLWRRHPRARFTAYILLSAVALRGAFGHSWYAVVFALMVLALMQTAPARQAWPPLTPGVRPGRSRQPDRYDEERSARRRRGPR